MPSINRIINGLYITSLDGVMQNETDTFDVVVSVCQDAAFDNVSDETRYEHFELADDAWSEFEWGGSYRYETFAAAAETTLAAFEDDAVQNVLVHCHAGRNRSAAVCAAVVACYRGQSFADAYSTVESARPLVDSNDVMTAHGTRFTHENR